MKDIIANIKEWEEYYQENSIRFTIDHFQHFEFKNALFNTNINSIILSPSDFKNIEREIIETYILPCFKEINDIQMAYQDLEEFKGFIPIDTNKETEMFLSHIEENFLSCQKALIDK